MSRLPQRSRGDLFHCTKHQGPAGSGNPRRYPLGCLPDTVYHVRVRSVPGGSPRVLDLLCKHVLGYWAIDVSSKQCIGAIWLMAVVSE